MYIVQLFFTFKIRQGATSINWAICLVTLVPLKCDQ